MFLPLIQESCKLENLDIILRTNDWPTSIGSSKAFDTSLVLTWLEADLSDLVPHLSLICFCFGWYFVLVPNPFCPVADPTSSFPGLHWERLAPGPQGRRLCVQLIFQDYEETWCVYSTYRPCCGGQGWGRDGRSLMALYLTFPSP